MSTLTIKDVPVDWAQALRTRASRNHRSLQGELMALLEQAVRENALSSDAAVQTVPTSKPHAPIAQFAPFAPFAAVGASAWGLGEGSGAAGSGQAAAERGYKSIEQVSAELLSKYPQRPDSGPSSAELIRQERDAR